MLLESLSFSDITAYLRELCQEKRTGTFFVLEGGHFLGRIGLRNGEIVSLAGKSINDFNGFASMLGNSKGDDSFTISFAEGAIPSAHMDLPPTAEILATLDGFDPATRSPQPSGQSSDLTADDKLVLEQTLCEAIGPIANMVCADYFPVATSLVETIDALADEILNPQAATEFRERVRQRMR